MHLWCANADEEPTMADSTVTKRIDFQTEPSRYRHWKLKPAGETAELMMDIDENAGLFAGYQLKINSFGLLREISLLAVLPGEGRVTRVTGKLKVRRELSDAFCTTEEGVKGKRAVQWRLVDRVATNSKFEAEGAEMVAELAASVKKPA